MEENLEVRELFDTVLGEEEINRMSPVVLAWIGDGVYSHFIREYLVKSQGITNVNRLNQKSVNYVRAQAQSLVVHQLIENILSEEEKDIVRRGRNANSHPPKHVSVTEYQYATGFEALLGFLALKGDFERIKELCAESIIIINRKS